MTEKFYIAAYCRISLDDDLNKENILIENQKAIIEDYVKTNLPNAELDFYEDKDKAATPLNNARAIRKCGESVQKPIRHSDYQRPLPILSKKRRGLGRAGSLFYSHWQRQAKSLF